MEISSPFQKMVISEKKKKKNKATVTVSLFAFKQFALHTAKSIMH